MSGRNPLSHQKCLAGLRAAVCREHANLAAWPKSVQRRLVALFELCGGASLKIAAKAAGLSRSGVHYVLHRVLSQGLSAILRTKEPQTEHRKPSLTEAQERQFIAKYVREKRKLRWRVSLEEIRAKTAGRDFHRKTKGKLLRKYRFIVRPSGVIQKIGK